MGVQIPWLTSLQQAQMQRLREPIVSAVDLNGNPVSQSDWNAGNDRLAQAYDRSNRSMASHNRLVNIGRLASIAPVAAAFAPAAAGAMGSAAAAAPAAVSAASVPTAAASGLSLRSFLSNPLVGLGVQGLFSWLGNRSQNKAADRATAAQMSAIDRQLQADAANRAEQARQFEITQGDARKANDAANAMRREELDFQNRMYLDREARLAPYRASADRARLSLQAFLGM